MTGRVLDEGLGKLHFWLMMAGFNITFFPMHFAGMFGMPRRVYTYSSGYGFDGYNLLSTVGAFLIAISMVVMILNWVRTMRPWQDSRKRSLGCTDPRMVHPRRRRRVYNFAPDSGRRQPAPILGPEIWRSGNARAGPRRLEWWSRRWG